MPRFVLFDRGYLIIALLLAVTVVVILFAYQCGIFPIRHDNQFAQNYAKLRVGMTLPEVEAILGKGTRETVENVGTVHPYGESVRNVVKGKDFYHWEGHNGENIWIGLDDERVVDKSLFEPSL